MTPTPPGRRVVVTRFETDDGPLATALRAAGAEPVVVPLIGIESADAGAHTALGPLSDFDWIAFTSANGVRIFWARLERADRTAFRAHRGIAAVGPATARAVANLGATAAITAPEFVAESLADALGDVTERRILWPRAAGARSVLSDTLRSRGAAVVEQILYDTVALSVSDQTRALDASRVSRLLGHLTPEQYAPVQAAVGLIFSSTFAPVVHSVAMMSPTGSKTWGILLRWDDVTSDAGYVPSNGDFPVPNGKFVVAGLTLTSASSVAHDLFANVFKKGSASEKAAATASATTPP